MTYTQGEWNVATRNCGRYWKAEVKTPDVMPSDGKHAIEFGQLIAVCYGKNTVANAHLISASPNLYLRLQEMTTMLENLLIEYPLSALNQSLLQAIKDNKQALAKAEGAVKKELEGK